MPTILSSVDMDWETPPGLIADLEREFGPFDVADLVMFLKGRVRFTRDGQTGPAPFPSAVIVWRAA